VSVSRRRAQKKTGLVYGYSLPDSSSHDYRRAETKGSKPVFTWRGTELRLSNKTLRSEGILFTPVLSHIGLKYASLQPYMPSHCHMDSQHTTHTHTHKQSHASDTTHNFFTKDLR
jgi:hypothetical protein